MGPCEDPPEQRENQDPSPVQNQKRRARRPRHRACLLKGCRDFFRPVHPLARYCSEACRQAARRWSQWKARRRYRESVKGRGRRQAQSRRYRRAERRRQPRVGPARGSSEEKKFWSARATVPAAMRALSSGGAPRCSDSVAAAAGGPWSGFGSGRSVGEREGGPGSGLGPDIVWTYCRRGVGSGSLPSARDQKERNPEPAGRLGPSDWRRERAGTWIWSFINSSFGTST